MPPRESQAEAIESIRDRYLAARKLDIFPREYLDQILEYPEYQFLKPKVENYLIHLDSLGIDSHSLSVVTHAIISLLHSHVANEVTGYAYYLQDQHIDPYEEADPEDEKQRTLIANWEKTHVERNMKITEDVADRIIAGCNNGEGTFSWLRGPMYSAKTDAELEILNELYYARTEYNNGKEIHTYIAAVLEENVIKSRRGGRGRKMKLRDYREADATPVNTQELIADLIDPEITRPGDVVLIDEISFIAFGEAENIALKAALEHAVWRGIHIVVGGLDTNYRAEPLDFQFYEPYAALPNSKIYDCESYCAYPVSESDAENSALQVEVATHTFRYDVQAAFADFLLPIPIGREVSYMVSYIALPEAAHPFLVLADYDPEVYAALIKVGENQALFDHYKTTHEA